MGAAEIEAYFEHLRTTKNLAPKSLGVHLSVNRDRRGATSPKFLFRLIIDASCMTLPSRLRRTGRQPAEHRLVIYAKPRSVVSRTSVPTSAAKLTESG